MSRVTKRVVSGVLSVAIIAIGFVVITNRYAVHDWIVTRNYQPSSAVAGLVSRAGLSSSSQRILFASKPQIDEKSSFNNDCPVEEKTIVLGCYTGSRVYILKVDDPRLSGVEEVTIAHETLHAVYARMSKRERDRIDTLVMAAYAASTDDHLKSLVATYQKDDPSSVPNELHSILGTEVKNIGPDLEAHYKKYFTDRSLVVRLSDQYESVFTDLQKKVALYDTQIESLKAQIDLQQTSLEQQRASLNTMRASMDDNLNQKRYAQYNTQVPLFNSKVRAFNAGVNTLNSLINQYNAIVKERNAIVVTQKELTQTIDSKYQPLESK